MVLDADGPEGLAALRALAAPYGGLPRTLCQQTGREGGLHIIYRGTGIKSTTHKDTSSDAKVSKQHRPSGSTELTSNTENSYFAAA